MHAIVGHNCRFLQGPDTDRDQVHKLKVALAEGREEVVILKNYRKDGTIPILIILFLLLMRSNCRHQLTNFFL